MGCFTMPKGMPTQKTQVVQELRQRHSLNIILSIAQLSHATFYYHLKRMNRTDQYEAAKAEITAIYHENKGRYGYCRITTEMHNRNFHLSHKTIQRLMKLLSLMCRVRMKNIIPTKARLARLRQIC